MDNPCQPLSTPPKAQTFRENPDGNDHDLAELLLRSSTPSHADDSSNDSLTLQIVLPASEKKRKINRRDRHINKEIEDHIKVLAKKPRKTRLTVQNVKSILNYVIDNESVLAMVSSSMKDAGEDLEIESTLTRSKARQLRKEKQIIWPLSPIQQPKPVDNEHLVLIREELPEEEDDDEYRPTIADLQDHSDDESGRQSVGTPSLNISSASRYLSNFDPDLLDDTAQDAPVPVNVAPDVPELLLDFKIPKENIGQRTRSKFSLSSTPLEAIEQAFIPPDITTDMYDFHCDNQEWENFLKEFMQPLSNDTADLDEEDDPEYNALEEEELDKEELRRDSRVTVPKSELKTLMMELFEGGDISSDEDVSKRPPQPDTPATTVISRLVVEEPEKEIPASPEPAPPSPVEEEIVIGLTNSQHLLLLQQTRQHVQLLTQNFLQTHRHPVLNKFSIKFKGMLVELSTLAKLNPDTAVNVFNLEKANILTDYWEKYLLSDEGSKIIRFQEIELEKARNAKRKKLAYTLKFHPNLIDLIMQNDMFLYPSMLPLQPFRPELSKNLEFVDAEDALIAIGLEQFVPYVQKYPQWYDGRQGLERLAADLIHELMLPAKTTMQIVHRVRRMKKKEGNPISQYFKHRKVENLVHHVVVHSALSAVPPKNQPQRLLPDNWKGT